MEKKYNKLKNKVKFKLIKHKNTTYIFGQDFRSHDQKKVML